MRARAGAAALAVCAALPLTACEGRQPSPEDRQRVIVLAASSLKEPFEEMERRYETNHPESDLVISYGPSSSLSQQVLDGAPADVFASAATVQMDPLVTAGRATDPRTFATNSLAIALAPQNPAGITQTADLLRPGVRVAACEAQVPCGVLTARWEAESAIHLDAATREPDVRAVITKVALGEADAGLVYQSDVLAAQDTGVTGIRLENAPTTEYPIARLNERGRGFVDYVTSADGHAVMQAHGFR